MRGEHVIVGGDDAYVGALIYKDVMPILWAVNSEGVGQI